MDPIPTMVITTQLARRKGEITVSTVEEIDQLISQLIIAKTGLLGAQSAIGARGDYRIRGIHVDDLARLCVHLGSVVGTVTVDAVGPQRLTFRELVGAIRAAVGSRSVVLPVPAPALVALSRALGLVLRDSLLTTDEYHAMADGLADSDAPSTGTIALTDWISEHRDQLGRRYANELARHFR